MLKKSLIDRRYVKLKFLAKTGDLKTFNNLNIHVLQVRQVSVIENIFCKLALLSKKGFIVEIMIWEGAGERIGGGVGTDWEGDWL